MEHQTDGLTNSTEHLTASSAQVQSEIQDYLNVRQQRRRLFPRAALVGLIAGLVAVALRVTLAHGDRLRNQLIAWAHQFPRFGIVFPICACATGAALSVVIVRRFAAEASGSGIPHLEAVLHRMRELRWKRILPVKYVAGALAMGSGLALGREGPTVQMGGAVGAAVGGWMKMGQRDRLDFNS